MKDFIHVAYLAWLQTAGLNRVHRLYVPLLHQRPDPVYNQPLIVLARAMRINSSFVTIHLPQGKHARLFAAPPDLELNHPRLLDGGVAQLPKKSFRRVGILGSECELEVMMKSFLVSIFGLWFV
jgi:hypothetical protein